MYYNLKMMNAKGVVQRIKAPIDESVEQTAKMAEDAMPGWICINCAVGCDTCGGSGSVETELYEGLVNCPDCH